MRAALLHLVMQGMTLDEGLSPGTTLGAFSVTLSTVGTMAFVEFM